MCLQGLFSNNVVGLYNEVVIGNGKISTVDRGFVVVF